MDKVDIELSANVDGPLLLITPKEGIDNIGDEFIFLFASDIDKYCEAFSNVFLRILPEGIADISENSCPEPTDLFQYEYIWPETQDFLSLNVNDYFIDPDGELFDSDGMLLCVGKQKRPRTLVVAVFGFVGYEIPGRR